MYTCTLWFTCRNMRTPVVLYEKRFAVIRVALCLRVHVFTLLFDKNVWAPKLKDTTCCLVIKFCTCIWIKPAFLYCAHKSWICQIGFIWFYFKRGLSNVFVSHYFEGEPRVTSHTIMNSERSLSVATCCPDLFCLAASVYPYTFFSTLWEHSGGWYSSWATRNEIQYPLHQTCGHSIFENTPCKTNH